MGSENTQLKKIRYNFQTKKFGNFYFQCDIGTDSPGSGKPSADL